MLLNEIEIKSVKGLWESLKKVIIFKGKEIGRNNFLKGGIRCVFKVRNYWCLELRFV